MSIFLNLIWHGISWDSLRLMWFSFTLAIKAKMKENGWLMCIFVYLLIFFTVVDLGKEKIQNVLYVFCYHGFIVYSTLITKSLLQSKLLATTTEHQQQHSINNTKTTTQPHNKRKPDQQEWQQKMIINNNDATITYSN